MKAALLLAVALGACAPAFAVDLPQPENRFAATIAPVERFDIGGTLVERHGQRGRPLILVPGLGSGAWAWQDTVRQFSGEHVVYVVTLAGFDGRAAVAGNTLDNAQNSLRELIVSRKLAKPVLVGHSLGAALSIAFAEQHSDLIGGVVAVDGLPVFPGSENAPAAQRAQMAAGVKASMAAASKEMFALQQQQYMRGVGTTDMARADELAKLSARSDPATMIDAMSELFALDLRPGLPNIKVPASQAGMTRDAKTAYYTSLMAGTPKLEVVSIAPSRHFVMFDQPQMLNDALRAYLKSL
jgi:pimeloyl-ACP methyl ester carboxylesterase